MPEINNPARLGHLEMLEAESIEIFREAVAEFQNPVMLYSIGKDSSVMVRLAQKAFYPGPIPFSLLHVDTGYKFHEMITFRDSFTQEIGARLIVHRNEEALAEGANPFRLGTQRCCQLLKTESLLAALQQGGYDAAFGGARRDEERSRPKSASIPSVTPRTMGPQKPATRDLDSAQWQARAGRKCPCVSPFELDGVGRMALHPRGADSHCAPLLRQRAMDGGTRRIAHSAGAAFCPARTRGRAATGSLPHEIAGMQPMHRGIRSDADTVPKIIEELISLRRSERENRVIDHDQDGSMELKKRAGYF